jgi:hypothetical protein
LGRTTCWHVDVVWLYSSNPFIPLPDEAIGRIAMKQLISFFDRQFPGDGTLLSVDLIARRADGCSIWRGQKSWKEVKVFINT